MNKSHSISNFSTARTLLAAAYLEYGQNTPCLQSLDFTHRNEAGARLTLLSGETLKTPPDLDAAKLYELIQEQAQNPISKPCQTQPPITENPTQTWANLLDDMGSYITVFTENSPSHPIELLHLRNCGTYAHITLSYRNEPHIFTYSYTGYPAALPVSLAQLVQDPSEDPFEPELRRVRP